MIKVIAVKTINNHTEDSKQYPMDGVFLAIGFSPNTKIFKGQVDLADGGYVALTLDRETSLTGVYAVGDIVDPRYKQA